MPKRVLQGVVVSDKGDKTIVVKVERRFTHPVLKKTVRRTKNYHAHDEGNVAKVGQVVQIEESRPYSKTKTWKLVDGASEGEGGGGLLSSVAETVGAAVGKAKAAVGLS
ncbi:MAG: 30S ribosomal protein S17 [Methylobacteriaceae bacterium]|nr:30S ribosomal protein S17 [Methylobacteriaceae bacterium]